MLGRRQSVGSWIVASLVALSAPSALAQKRPRKAVTPQRLEKKKPKQTTIAEATPSSGAKIVSLEVQGQLKIEKDAILARIKSKPGDFISRERIHEDVLDVFKMGYFYDIQVDQQMAPDGAKIVFKVLEKPSIAEIKFNGQSSVSEDDLREAMAIKAYEILDLTKVRAAIEKMAKVYEEKGFFLARINYRIEDVKAGETVRLNFDIEENDKVKVKRINFLGNYRLKRGELEGVMITKEEGFFSFLSSSGAYKQDAFDRDVQVLNYLYFNKGYVQVKIARPQVYVTPDKKSIYITIRIEEGDQFDVGEVDFSGDLLMGKEELFQAIKIKNEKTFNYEVLQQDLQILQAKYGDLGYAFANIIPRTQVREKEKLVDVTFEIEKGNKVHFGEINMLGNSKTRDKVIRRELMISEGELYNETRKRESLANVKRLGFFDDVQFNQKTPPDNPDVLNLDINVKERNTGSIQIGAGYSTFQGFIFNGQIQQANLFGKGQRLGIAIDTGQRISIFNLNFTEPYVYDTLWSAGFDLYRSQRILLPFQEVREGGAVRLGHPIVAPYLVGILRYRNDHTNIQLNQGVDNNLFPVQTANGRTSSITGTIEYDKRDDRMMPSSGEFFSTSLEYAGLGGNNRFTKGFATGRYYRKLFWNVISRNNLSYGYVAPLDPNGEPPFNELFLLGGANTLRGYQWFSVGKTKRDALGVDRPFGGRSQVVFNTELEFPLIQEAGLRGAIFYDAGQAEDIVSMDAFRSNVGFGFRWFSPIGPLRFEWGFPIARRQNDVPVNFEFAIGSPF